MTLSAVSTQPGSPPPIRFGGELPLGCDALLPAPRALPGDVLLFSHGRAALGWLIGRRGPFASAALSAYTCPSVPRFLEAAGLALGLFDHGEPDPLPLIRALPKPCLVLVPAPFGLSPWLDAAALAAALGEDACVVIDAAQAAFGFEDFAAPPGGAVLACPRKTLALGDGAVLRPAALRPGERESVEALPMPDDVARKKQAARALFAAGDPAREAEALTLAQESEAALPATPHRMSAASRHHFVRVDPAVHAARRRANAEALKAALGSDLESPLAGEGTPFDYPVLVEHRDEVIKRLHARRVFATPLWPDARHDPSRHPNATRLARGLVGLPVDQRYTPDDMVRLAALVRACL
ncbi:MAG: hypothetical protein AB7P52_08705 [Alphaproteobacteria bacterium]